MLDRFDEVLDEAAVLASLDAARAEVWVSGLVAEWDDPQELLALLAGSRRVEAAHVVHALRVLVPEAEAVARHAAAAGLPTPEWAPHIGSAVAVGAWAISDPFSGNVSVVIEYEHDDQVRHSMLVEIENAAAIDVLFGPPDLVDDAFDGSDTRSLSVDEIDIADATSRIVAALGATMVSTETVVTEEFQMNVALAAARVGLSIGQAGIAGDAMASPAGGPAPRHSPAPRAARDEEEAELDAAAVGTLRAALSTFLTAPSPTVETAIRDQAASVRSNLDGTASADLDALADDQGVTGDLDDVALLARLAGAFVVPGELAAFSPPAREAIRSLEWADWLGAVIPLVRSGPGTAVDPDTLVRNINRCPEVTTTVPARDAPAVAGIFATVLHAWELTGVLDDDGYLTEFGQWLLPRALLDAWGDESAFA